MMLLHLIATALGASLFLTYTDQQYNAIMSLPVQDQKQTLTALTAPKVLIPNLKLPTHMAYAAKDKIMFVCDSIGIWSYHIRVMSSGLAASNGTLLNQIHCSGMSLDQFGNFYFIDTSKDAIGFLPQTDIKNASQIAYKYEGFTFQDISIEGEMMYWAANNTLRQAFTEPFIRAVPLQQTYNLTVVDAISICYNNHMIFMTNSSSLWLQQKSSLTSQSISLNDTGAVIAYKDVSLLVASKNTIRVIDLQTLNSTNLTVTGSVPSLGLAFITDDMSLIVQSCAVWLVVSSYLLVTHLI